MGYTPAERSAYLFVEQEQARAVGEESSIQSLTITLIAQAEAGASLAIGEARQEADLTIAQNQYLLYVTSANVQAGAQLISANLQATAITTIAGYEVANIQTTARVQVNQISQGANAQSNEIAQVASISAAGTVATASIQAALTTSEAAIQASRITTISQIQASTVQITASIDRSQGLVVAGIEVGGIQSEAAIHVSERNQERDIRVEQIAADATIASQLTLSLAGIQANEINQRASIDVREIRGVAGEDYRGATVAANERAIETVTVATIHSVAAIEVAEIKADYDRYSALRRSEGVHFRADTERDASEFAATAQAELVVYRAEQGYQGILVSSNQNLQGVQYQSDGEYTRRVAAATTEANAREYGADRDLAGVQAKEAASDQTLQDRLAFLLEKFNNFFPSFVASLAPRIGPGLVTTQPALIGGLAYTPSQVQMRVNAAYVDATVAEGTALQEMRADYAARGFSGQSPGVYHDRVALVAQKLRAFGAAGTLGKTDALILNSQLGFEIQLLRSQLWAATQQAYIDMEKAGIQRQVGFEDSLTQIIGSV